MASRPGKPGLIQKSTDGVLMPGSAAKFLEGEIALIRGDAKSAIDAYASALSMDSGNPFLVSSLARAHHADGNDGKAEELVKKVLTKDPQYEFALNLYARIHEERGNVAEAQHYYKAAIASAPESAENYLCLIGLHKNAGDLAAAFDAAEQLTAAVPDEAEGYGLSAQLAFSLGMIATSKERTLQVVKMTTLDQTADRWELLKKQGISMLEAGSDDFALLLLETYLGLVPGDTAAIEAMVMTLKKLGRTKEARLAAGRLKDEDLFLKAQLLYATGAWQEALDTLEAIPEDTFDAGKSRSAKVIRAVALADAMKPGEAKAQLDAFDDDELPWRAEALSGVALLLLSSGMGDDAAAIVFHDPSAPLAVEKFDVMHALASALAGGSLNDPGPQAGPALPESSAWPLLVHWSGFLSGAESDGEWLAQHIDGLLASGASDSLKNSARIVKAILVGEKIIKANQTGLLDLIVKIEKHDPSCALAASLRARFFMLIGNKERAGHWFERAENVNPADYLTRLWHAEYLLDRKEKKEAQALLASSAGLNPPMYFLKRILALVK
ncbi:MAG: tetratricopeptide repeat protein [Pseudomonadota bacterium]